MKIKNYTENILITAAVKQEVFSICKRSFMFFVYAYMFLVCLLLYINKWIKYSAPLVPCLVGYIINPVTIRTLYKNINCQTDGSVCYIYLTNLMLYALI